MSHFENGSAASLRPSPMKVKASTVMTTRRAGVSNHGEKAIDWMFCASVRRTPQLKAGGRIPSPKKLRLVSLRIITGTASVKEAMI